MRAVRGLRFRGNFFFFTVLISSRHGDKWVMGCTMGGVEGQWED